MANTAKKSRPHERENRGSWAERVTLPDPADQNEPGSIEQQLDMVEGRGPRGDEVLHHKGRSFEEKRDPNWVEEMDEDSMMLNYHVDMADSNREGDEMSGDDHSLGLQGGDSEFEPQPTFHDGLPGEETREENELGKAREGELPFSRNKRKPA